MTAIGSLMFCNDCGELLDASTSLERVTITCAVCGAKWKDTSIKSTVTKSKPTDFPSAIRAKRSQVQALNPEDAHAQSTGTELCPKCHEQREVRFYEQQLRSADEGSTVFYTCTTCGEKWNTNN